MKITWYAHSCFLVETESGSAVLDPYAPGSVPGLSLPPLEADLVLCSHEHSDHNYRAGVKLSGKAAELRVEKIQTFHDEKQGALRGPNTIHALEAEGLRVAHLGDLGHRLSEAQTISPSARMWPRSWPNSCSPPSPCPCTTGARASATRSSARWRTSSAAGTRCCAWKPTSSVPRSWRNR